MIDDLELRKFIFENNSYVKNISITKHQKKILEWIKLKGEVTSADYVKLMGVSIQCASGNLTGLFYNGWLVRRKEPDPTGGIICIYKMINLTE